MVIGLVLLLCSNGASWLALRQISHREATHAAARCADPRGDQALRTQWARIAELIRRTGLKPSDPMYLPPKQASRQFALSYDEAIRSAGPPPQCLGGGG